ncbi:MAG: gliding motility lipoprotein GldH [Bacteroidetes bacterium]|nr:gliding motility lipoprotein GldH [Bacteroidota bacterium]MBV6462290.1 Gliding motility lipoprotein GldH [Flavobacteriales bacterium]WKZ74874.1 MAG: gliding motility lipoprotein GldH [Vicingaceae bacterium]MCL4816096.1 gliding motility lipoprotein GldH [Flavobacteriales bacterium]NOG95255.1 gliding motility lipoprotein GldH [Bacteroidota bacterium]
MKNSASYIFLFFLSLVFLACDKNRVFEQNITVEGGSWAMDNMATFEFEITDTLAEYNILINIRNRNDYPYNNIYLFLQLTAPDGKKATDTLNCLLADEKGRFLGKSAGNLWDNRIPYKWGVKFPMPGKYKVNYIQAMRHEKLEAITDVGLRIEKNSK